MKRLSCAGILFLFLGCTVSSYAAVTLNLGYQRMMKSSEKLQKFNYGLDFQDQVSNLDILLKTSGEYGQYEKNNTKIMIENYLFLGDIDFFLLKDQFSVLTYHSYKYEIMAQMLLERYNGGGVKYYFYRDGKEDYFSFSVIGLSWKKDYLGRSSKSDFRLSFRPKFAVTLFERCVFKTAFYYKPNIHNWADSIIESESSLDLQLKPYLFLSPVYKFTYYRLDHFIEETGMAVLKIVY